MGLDCKKLHVERMEPNGSLRPLSHMNVSLWLLSPQLKSGFSRSRETAKSTKDLTFAGARLPSGYIT